MACGGTQDILAAETECAALMNKFTPAAAGVGHNPAPQVHRRKIHFLEGNPE